MVLNKLKFDLAYVAAKMFFGSLDVKYALEIFDKLMDEGVWIDEFIDLEESKQYRVDFEKTFTSALDKLEIDLPKNEEEAIWIILKKNIYDIALENIDPLSGLLQLIEDVYDEYDFAEKSSKYEGDSHGIHLLINLYWMYDDLIQNERWVDDIETEKQELKKEILMVAKAWIEQCQS